MQAKLEECPAVIQLVPAELVPAAMQSVPQWRVHHPKLDGLLPPKPKRMENGTMQITARATRILKEVGELIATVQQMCAVKKIAPMRIAIYVDMKREKDAVWCAAALREFLVQNRYDMLAHIEVGKLDPAFASAAKNPTTKSYLSQTEKSKKGRKEKIIKGGKETASPLKVEFHILPLSSDILLHEHDVKHQRQAMQIEHSFLFDGTSAQSRSKWATDFGLECRELCSDQELRSRTDPRVWITLQALASHVYAHFASKKVRRSTVGHKHSPASEDADNSANDEKHSPASEDADNSVDDEVLRQTTMIRIGLRNANRSSDRWCRTVSSLISVFERSDRLLAITDPRIVACLRVARSSLEEVNIRPENPKPIQLPADIQIISEFKCPYKDPLVPELCKQLEQAAAQLQRPDLFNKKQGPRCARALKLA